MFPRNLIFHSMRVCAINVLAVVNELRYRGIDLIIYTAITIDERLLNVESLSGEKIFNIPVSVIIADRKVLNRVIAINSSHSNEMNEMHSRNKLFIVARFLKKKHHVYLKRCCGISFLK